MSRTITVSTTVVVLVLVFALTGVPAWAYLLPAAIAVVEVALQVRARRIDGARRGE